MPVPCALDLACPYCQLLPQPESMPWNFANMRTVPEKRWRWHKDADAIERMPGMPKLFGINTLPHNAQSI